MRLINVLFALYVAFLVCYPCTDDADDRGFSNPEAFAQHKGDANEVDPCSPLCVCQCCSAQTHQPTYFTFSAFCPNYTEKHEITNVQSITTVSNSIWQPPKQV